MANETGIFGWISQPDGRGTLDILQNCFFTMVLCSWCVLFLNVPPEGQKRSQSFAIKLKWLVFTLFFPEMLSGISAEQWRSARQSVEDFSELRQMWESQLQSCTRNADRQKLLDNISIFDKNPWRLRHAFFADMGGCHLQCSDFVPFPVNSHQLCYLVRTGYMQYPGLDPAMISDKNKVDVLARIITLTQTSWFVVQCIGRVSQRLALSSLELSTLSFVFCTVATYFFWFHKPMDVGSAITLNMSTKMADVLTRADACIKRRYDQTPLDFVSIQSSGTSLITSFWFGLRTLLGRTRDRNAFPVRTISNIAIVPPRGLKVVDVLFGIPLTLAYFGIYLAGWRFAFPTSVEKYLWRITSLVLLGLSTIYFVAVWMGHKYAKKAAAVLFPDE